MKFEPKKHHRRSIRLKDYDYSQPGWYFVTLCTKNREMLFGDVVDRKLTLNKLGEIAEKEWQKTEKIRKNIKIDQFVVMPNHIHGIIGILDEESIVRANSDSPQREPQSTSFQSPSKTIGAIIRGYKASVTNKINIFQNTHGLPIWQSNYYERIIRNESELNRIRKYIINNPRKWQDDKYY